MNGSEALGDVTQTCVLVERSLLEELERRAGEQWVRRVSHAVGAESASTPDVGTITELKTNHTRVVEYCQTHMCSDSCVTDAPTREEKETPRVTTIVHASKRFHIGDWEVPDTDGKKIVPFFHRDVADAIQRTGFHHAGLAEVWRKLSSYPVGFLLHVHQGLFESISQGLQTVQVQALTDDVENMAHAMQAHMDTLKIHVPASVLELRWSVLDMNPLIGSAGTFPSLQADYVIVYGNTAQVKVALKIMARKFAETGLSASGDLHVRVWVVRTDSVPFDLTECLDPTMINKFRVQQIGLYDALMMAAFYHCTLFSPNRSALFMYGVSEVAAFMKALREKK